MAFNRQHTRSRPEPGSEGLYGRELEQLHCSQRDRRLADVEEDLDITETGLDTLQHVHTCQNITIIIS